MLQFTHVRGIEGKQSWCWSLIKNLLDQYFIIDFYDDRSLWSDIHNNNNGALRAKAHLFSSSYIIVGKYFAWIDFKITTIISVTKQWQQKLQNCHFWSLFWHYFVQVQGQVEEFTKMTVNALFINSLRINIMHLLETLFFCQKKIWVFSVKPLKKSHDRCCNAICQSGSTLVVTNFRTIGQPLWMSDSFTNFYRVHYTYSQHIALEWLTRLW